MASNKSQKSKKKLVLIGSSGFKGEKLIQTLDKDKDFDQIIAIDRFKPKSISKKLKFYKLDLTENTADSKLAEIFQKEKVDCIFHAAFPVTPPKNTAVAHELISIGTMYILNAAAAARVKKIILASTTDVYGASAKNPNFLTEDKHQPQGHKQSRFLADKIEAEKMCLRYAKKYPGSQVCILRPCTILGPSIQSYKTRIFQRPFVLSVLGFDPLLQFLHEDDLLQAFLLSLKKDISGIFNIVGNGVLPLSRVIEITGKKNLGIPQLALKSIVELAWTLDISPAPSSHIDFLRYTYVADGSKAEQELGFKPKFSSKEALLSFVGAQRLRELSLLKEEKEKIA